MGNTKKKAVFTAEPEQLEAIDEVVRCGRYRSTSAFVREAIDEKLERLRRERLEEQVARFCAEGPGVHDDGLVELQAWDDNDD